MYNFNNNSGGAEFTSMGPYTSVIPPQWAPLHVCSLWLFTLHRAFYYHKRPLHPVRSGQGGVWLVRAGSVH